MNFNKIILGGHLTRDPVLSYLPSQTPVVECGIATNYTYTAKDGTKRESACFVDLKAFGKTADTINQYFHKGDPILIEGRLDFDQWESQDGTKRSKHRVVVESFSFVAKSGGEAAPAPKVRTPNVAAVDDDDDNDFPF